MNRVLARLLNRVLMIEAGCLAELLSLAEREQRGWQVSDQDVSAAVMSRATPPGPIDPQRAAQALGVQGVSVTAPTPAKPFTQVGATAVIDIWGVLDQNDEDVQYGRNGVVLYRWGTSYQMIRREYAAAMADESVRGILLRCNSPGGEAMMVEQIGLVLHSTRGVKKTVALADPMMASAMLYLGAQAAAVYTTPGGWVGSIGTISYYADCTKYMADVGIKVTAIKSHAGKDAGSPYREMSEEDRKRLQSEVNAYGAQFDAALRRGRGVDQAKVEAWKTTERGYVGQAAADNGLVDGVVSDAYALIAQMEKSYTAGSSGTPRAAGRGAGAGNTALEGGAAMHSQGDGVMKWLNLDPGAKEGGGGGGGGSGGGTGAAAPAGAVGGGGAAGTGGAAGAALAPVDATAVLRAERSRVADIDARHVAFSSGPFVAYAPKANAIRDKARAEGWSAQQYSDAVVAMLAQESPPTGHVPGGGSTGGQSGLSDAELRIGAEEREKKLGGVQAALLTKLYNGIDAALASSPPDDPRRADRIAGALGGTPETVRKSISISRSEGVLRMSVIEMVCFCASARGAISFEQAMRMHRESPQRFMSNVFHTSSDFPLLMANVANKALLARYMEVKTVWRSFCRVGVATDYKSAPLLSISNMGNFEDLPEGRTPGQTSFDERQESIAVAPMGKRFGLTYQQMRNDDLNVFGQRLQLLGNSAARAPEDKFIALLAMNSSAGPTMSDGDPLFHSNHLNISTSAALAYAGLQADFTAFRRQKTFGANPVFIDVEPATLLVATENAWLAEDLAMQETVPAAAASPSAATQKNTLRGRFRVEHTPRLTGNRRWLFADPNRAAVIEVRFLDGKETPEIVELPMTDPMQMEMQATLLGIGISAVQWEGALTNAGG